jgi:phosphoribulokinase
MTTAHDVLWGIAELADRVSRRPLLVGVDGLGGSGKSTLAGVLHDAPQVSAVVSGDDFYGPEVEGWAGLTPEQGYERFFDHERLAHQVLGPLSRRHTAWYQRYDWQRNVLGEWTEIRAVNVIVVEGVYLLRPDLRRYWDLSVFVDAPWEVRLARQVARGENTVEAIRLWMDAEKYYERVCEPRAHADLVLRGH